MSRKGGAQKNDKGMFVVNKCTQNQFQEMGVVFTRHEVRKLWSLLETKPKLLEKTHWLKEKMDRAKEIYASDLRHMGNSVSLADLSTVNGLEVTGHAGKYWLDVYAAFGLILISVAILYPSHTADFVLQIVSKALALWHDLPAFYSFVAMIVAIACLLVFFALGNPAPHHHHHHQDHAN